MLDFPGVVSWGPDLNEARQLLSSALADMAELNLERVNRSPGPGVHAEVLDFPGVVLVGAKSDLNEARQLLSSALADMAELNLEREA